MERSNNLHKKYLKEKKFFENILNNFNFTINELENLEQLIDLALKENDLIVVKDCEKKYNFFLIKLKKLKFHVFYLKKMTI